MVDKVMAAQATTQRREGTEDRVSFSAVTAPPFLWLLVATALADWLLTRTLTRFAIFIPKTPAMIAGYQAMGWVGQVGSALAAILALAAVAWLVREEWSTQPLPWLGLALAGLAGLSLFFLVRPPGDWLLAYHLLLLAVLAGLAWRALRLAFDRRLAALLPAAAMAAAALHQAGPTAYAALGWPGPPAGAGPAFLAGEALMIAGAGALWWAYGRRAGWRIWLAAGLPAFFFAAAYLAAPAMTATIAIWSTGLTLFLPWWLYAAALWLAGVAVLQNGRTGEPTVAVAALLLATAGYAAQSSSQLFFGLIAIWLLISTFLVASSFQEGAVTARLG